MTDSVGTGRTSVVWPVMRVPFADLSRGTHGLRTEIDAALARVLDRGWFILGEEGAAFEREFADALGAKHAVGVASGTDAIELCLRALDIGSDDEVITQANTCIPTVAAIERTGARPVLCDVEPEAGTMSAVSLERALTGATRAIVPVHLYGQCADMDRILTLAAERGIPVVEDCAQAHLATFGERAAGTLGDLGAFSFYPTKNLGAVGDAGAVVTSDDALAERLRLLRRYGQSGRYEHIVRGVNSRLDEIQAAILRAKLPGLRAGNDRRGDIAAIYDAALAGGALRPLARLPHRTHAFHLYVVRTPERERVQAELAERGITTLIHYPRPVHGHPGYADLGSSSVDLGNSELLAQEVLSLPLFPELTDEEVSHVADALHGISRAGVNLA
jgi:dTDP-4-amino-4,6-dideoxygalactose transaminase